MKGSKKRYLTFLLFVLLISMIGCKSSTEEEYYSNIGFLYSAIPDKYNCGANESTAINTLDEDGLLNGVYIKIDKRDTKFYVITSYVPKNTPELPASVTIEDYNFSDADFRIYNPDRYSEKKTITFKNCKFKSFKNNGAYDDNKINIIFEHCSFGGGVNEVNIELNWCKIGHFPTDGMNPLKNFTVKNCFVYDLACEGNKNGTHIDGFQIYGRGNTKGGNILFDNVRFEIPSIYYEGNTSYVNACVMYQLEYGDVSNCTFQNLICNGGGKWYPIYFKKTKCKQDGTYYKKGEAFPESNVSLKNVLVSNNFDKIFYPTEHYESADIQNVTHLDKLYVSSIFKTDDNKIHIICSNDTRDDKELTVITDKETYRFEMPHCPSNWALGGEKGNRAVPNESLVDKNGIPYKSYTYKDLPFDVDCIISGDVKTIKCYDDQTLLAQWN